MPINHVDFQPVARPVKVAAMPNRPTPGPMPVQSPRPEAPTPPQRPTPPPSTNGFLQVAEALAQINPQINGFLNSYFEGQREEANAKFRTELETLDEAKAKEFYSKNREALDPLFRGALDRQFAVKLGTERIAQIDADLRSGALDPLSTDLDGVLRERFKADLEGYQSPEFSESYRKVVSQAVPQFRQFALQRQAEERRSERDQNYFDISQSLLTKGRERGAKPEEIWQAIRGLHVTHGPGTVLNMDRRTMGELDFRLVQYAADQGWTDFVEYALEADRGDAPKFSKDAKLQDKVDAVRKTVQLREHEKLKEQNYMTMVGWFSAADAGKLGDPSRWMEENGELAKQLLTPVQLAGLWEANRSSLKRQAVEAQEAAGRQWKANFKSFVATQAASMVGQGKYHWLDEVELTNPYDRRGDSVKLTRSEVMQTGLEIAMQGVVQKNPDGSINAEATAVQQIGLLSRNGAVYEPWKRIVENGYMAVDFAGQDDASRKAFSVGYEKYRQMKALNPELAAKHAPGDAGLFYDAVEFAETELYGGDREAAIRHAVRAKENQKLNLDRYSAIPRDQKERLVNQIRTSERWMLLFGRAADGNMMLGVEAALDRKAKQFMITAGVTSAEKAYELAAKRMVETYRVVNGLAMDMSNLNLPRNYEELSAFAAQRYFDRFGAEEGIDSPSDLVLVPHNNGSVFFLFHKGRSVEPSSVTDKDETGLRMGYFSAGDLLKLEAARMSSVRQQTEDAQARNQTAAVASAQIDAETTTPIEALAAAEGKIIDSLKDPSGFVHVGDVDWKALTNSLPFFNLPKWDERDAKLVKDVTDYATGKTISHGARSAARWATGLPGERPAMLGMIQTRDTQTLRGIKRVLEEEPSERGDKGDLVLELVKLVLQSRGEKAQKEPTP